MYRRLSFLVHLSDEVVDLVFSVSEVTTFDEVVGDSSVAANGGGELEGPEEVVGLNREISARESRTLVVEDKILTRLKLGPTV